MIDSGQITLESAQTASEATLKIIADVIKYQKANAAAIQVIDSEQLKEKLTWFGGGGYYNANGQTYVSYVGFCNPKTLVRIREWETNGFYGLATNYWMNRETGKLKDFGMGKEEFDEKILKKLAASEYKNKDYIKDLITGDINIREITDMTKFNNAIGDLQSLVNNLNNKNKVIDAPNIQSWFMGD